MIHLYNTRVFHFEGFSFSRLKKLSFPIPNTHMRTNVSVGDRCFFWKTFYTLIYLTFPHKLFSHFKPREYKACAKNISVSGVRGNRYICDSPCRSHVLSIRLE